MKYQQLKKRLVLESGVIAAVLAVLGGSVFFLGSISDDYQKETDALEKVVNGIATDTGILRTRYDKVQQNGELYREVTQLQSEDKLSINQQAAKNRFNLFRDQYYLNDMHLNMSPITEMKDPNYRRKAYVIASSEGNVDFEGLSDEYTYGLLNAIQRELPGSSKIVKLTLTRQGAVTEEALRTISEKGGYSLVKSEIKFIWFGIKPVESDDGGTDASKNK